MSALKLIPLILLAGMAGTLCRYLGLKLASAWSASFPFGTFAVNIAGAFLAGLLFALAKNRMPGLAPCLLGAFTTFSTFMLESVNLALSGSWGKAALNLLGQNITGCLAAFAGISLGRII